MNRKILIGLNLLVCACIFGFGLYGWFGTNSPSDTHYLTLIVGVVLSFISAIYWTLTYAKTSKAAQLAAKILVASFAILIFASMTILVLGVVALSTWNP